MFLLHMFSGAKIDIKYPNVETCQKIFLFSHECISIHLCSNLINKYENISMLKACKEHNKLYPHHMIKMQTFCGVKFAHQKKTQIAYEKSIIMTRKLDLVASS